MELEPDENPDEVFAELRNQVKTKLLHPDEMRGVEQALAEDREKKEELKRKIQELEARHQDLEFAWKAKILPRWRQAETILNAHGIQLPELPSIDFDSGL